MNKDTQEETKVINEFAKDTMQKFEGVIDGGRAWEGLRNTPEQYRHSIKFYILSKDIKSYTRYFTYISFGQGSYIRGLDSNRFGFKTYDHARNYILEVDHSNKLIKLLFDYIDRITLQLERVNERQQDIFSSIAGQNKIYTEQLNKMITKVVR